MHLLTEASHWPFTLKCLHLDDAKANGKTVVIPILCANTLRENQMVIDSLRNIIVLARSTDKRFPTLKLQESFFWNPPGTWRLFMLPLTAYAVHTYNT